MKRDITEKLLTWKRSSQRKPLILCGARQVGKTYSLESFGRDYYDNVARVNFLNTDAQSVLKNAHSAKQVISNIRVYTDVDIKPENTLVILDEIQQYPEMLTLMKDFCESIPEYHIAAAGSYLGIATHAGVSFPVGKVNLLDMYPMTFLEFLDAVGQSVLATEVVRALDFDRMQQFSDRLERLIRQYYYVGGMPEVVATFARTGEDHLAVRNIQKDLLAEYSRDFSKHYASENTDRMRLAFDSIPAHLGRENHKFVFGRIAKGARSRDYETALQALVDSGLTTRVYRISKLVKPLKFYRDLSAFKVYLPDIGLLGCALEVSAKDVLLSNVAFEEYKGALTEQYVCQQLVAAGNTPYYWSAENATAEVDFVVMKAGVPAPFEVKAEENLRAKSLRLLCEKTNLHGYRASMSGYREQDWMTNIPLWAVGAFFDASTEE